MARTIAPELGLTREQLEAGLALLEQPRTVTRRKQTYILPPRVTRDDHRFFLSELHAAETAIARHVRRLQSAELGELALPADAFGQLTPDESQRLAVETACRNGVIVMTGGPGVGKTTVARAIIAAYENAGLLVQCCAPTGKAAIRMRQQTGRSAKTIHQTIQLVPGGAPRHNESQPLYAPSGQWLEGGPIDAGAVVVDESSMIDVELMADLLAAIATGARLLIIGDVDQLPSIGAGRVLFDLLASQSVPTVRLTKIHRQASESRIPYVARDINTGRLPDQLALTGSDFTHWETPTAEAAAERIVRSLADPAGSITTRKGIPVTDIQVVAAQYKGPCGVEALNIALQDQLNFRKVVGGDVFVGRGYSVRTGDRVIHCRNNYDLLVMNGEMGYVIDADPKGVNAEDHLNAEWTGKHIESDGGDDYFESDDVASTASYGGLVEVKGEDGHVHQVFDPPRTVVIDFGDRKVAYTREECRELELGYAVSVHRAQGSQFPAVVVALHAQSPMMLTRALLYTAITRAERFCLTVGTAEQLGRAARNTRGADRRTSLQDRLAKTTTNEASGSLTFLTLK